MSHLFLRWIDVSDARCDGIFLMFPQHEKSLNLLPWYIPFFTFLLRAKVLRALEALERLLDLNFLSWFISPPVFNTHSTLHGSAVEVQEPFIWNTDPCLQKYCRKCSSNSCEVCFWWSSIVGLWFYVAFFCKWTFVRCTASENKRGDWLQLKTYIGCDSRFQYMSFGEMLVRCKYQSFALINDISKSYSVA